ncbi:MAG: NADH-quinone oxidoreductase subunit C [Deltaproteobacteria bacterium]|nr:NADH-quinone oxidoreductase subunit C [Deltaproteobacteria bacterium]
MNGNTTTVEVRNLLGEATRLKIDGYRLVTLSGVNTGPDQVEILYHFDKDLTLVHLRLAASREAPVPSISPIYPAAFLAENEIQDLFHIRFHGLVIDYQGTLFLPREMESTPFCRYDRSETPRPVSPDPQSAKSAGGA